MVEVMLDVVKNLRELRMWDFQRDYVWCNYVSREEWLVRLIKEVIAISSSAKESTRRERVILFARERYKFLE